MTQDPYGYDEAAGGDDPAGQENLAIQVLWTGIGAMVLFLIAPCLCYVPYFAAVPVGFYATFRGLGATGAQARGTRNMALAGVLTGTVAAGFSALVLVVLIGYFVLVGAAVAFGNR